MAALSIVGAFLEAASLGLLVVITASVANGRETVTLTMSGWFRQPLVCPTSWLIITAVMCVSCRVGVQLFLLRMETRLTTSYEAEVRRGLIRSFLAASWNVQARERLGVLQALCTENVAQGMKALHSISHGLVCASNFLVLFTSAFVLSPVAAGALILAVGILIGATRPLVAVGRKHAYQKAELNVSLGNQLNQLLLMAREVRVFGGGEALNARFDSVIERVRQARKAGQLAAGIVPVMYQNSMILIGALGLGAAWSAQITNLAPIAAAALLLVRAAGYAQGWQLVYLQLVESIPFLDQLNESLERYREGRILPAGRPIGSIERLEFVDVGYTYDRGAEVLSALNFAVERGQLVGIVGPSGSGKTTLTQLVLGLRHPTRGQILANGQPTEGVAATAWFERVAFVPQEPMLFDETIAESVRFFRDNVTEEQINAAIARAGLLPEVLAMPDGCRTRVGERGSRLSGGQRQRVCIARALAGDPDVVVFDEPTSALDAKSESIIVESIGGLRGRAAVFVVAHRLSTLSMCDKVMVLSHGSIEAYGPWESTDVARALQQEVIQIGLGK